MVQKHKIHNSSDSSSYIWKIATFVFAALFFISIFTSVFQDFSFNFSNDDVNTTSDEETTIETEIKVTVLNDKRCSDCELIAEQVLSQLQIIFPNLIYETIDYSSNDGKEMYDSLKLTTLPAFLFDHEVSTSSEYSQIQPYLLPVGDFESLLIGASFDPTAEICNNGVDDTGDGKIDCQATECQATWECVQKSDKPVVELFVMSHCPYGTQIEKGFIPVLKTLQDKIDFQLKFVNYAMHGEVELKEQTTQYCIEKEYSKEKLIDYLECFLEDGDSNRCVQELSLDSEVISTCFNAVDEEYSVLANFNDKSTWMGSFPPFNIYLEDNLKYNVAGSPTLIINGATPSAGRDANSLLEAICFTFNNKPEECNVELSSETPSPGFGYNAGTATTATC